jgi:prefoldin subunit 5
MQAAICTLILSQQENKIHNNFRRSTMSQKKNSPVVRNRGYARAGFTVRERHNERKNAEYGNGDICPEREHLNVHFRQNFSPDGTPETYAETYNRLLAEGTIVEKGLRADAKIFAELVFDVNTDYFERKGGYEFARKFYEEAYRLAVKEVGDERYILSAVLHADEKNSALSKALGRDVYHYHLHVVYVPVVMKDVLWSKRTKDPSLIGTVKERIPQVSHSKKWPIRVKAERDGKMVTLNSYSLLQDRYFEHMKAAGFDDIERGERGSTKEHLETLDYKIQQDEKRLEVLDRQIEKKETQIEKLDAKLEVKQTKAATLAEVDAMGHSLPLVPGLHLSDDEAKRLKALARKSIGVDKRPTEYQKKIDTLNGELRNLDSQIRDLRQSYGAAARERDSYKQNYNRLLEEVKPFLEAIRKFPQQLLVFVRTLFPQKNHNKEVQR